MNQEFTRILFKRSEISGVIPSINTGSTFPNDTWLSTDIMVGECFINVVDGRYFFRDQQGIKEFFVSGATTFDTFVTGGTFSSGTLTLDRNDGNSVNVSGFTFADNFVTGGTYNSGTEEIDFFGTSSATTFSVNVSALLDDTNTFVTGGTLSSGILSLDRNDGNTVSVTGFTDNFTTGATLVGNVVVFDRNDQLSAYTVNIGSVNTDNFTTGVTLNGTVLEFDRTDALSAYTVNIGSVTDNFLPLTGGTLTGSLSATTYFGDGSNLTGILTTDNFTTGGTYNSFTEEIDFVGTNSATTFSVDVSALLDDTNTFVTGGTFSSATLTLDRNDGNSVNVSGFTFADNFTTGGTISNGVISFDRTDALSAYTVDINSALNDYLPITGGTITGSLDIAGDVNIISDAYFNGDLLIFGLTSGSTSDEVLTFNTLNSKVERKTIILPNDNFTTAATLSNNTIFFDRTDALSAYTVDLSSIISTGGTQNLSQVLTVGNETLGNNIVLTSGDTIESSSGAGRLNLRDGFDDFVSLGNGFKRIEFTTNQVNLIHSSQNGIQITNTDFVIKNEAAGVIKMTSQLGANFGELQIVNSSSINSTSNSPHFPVFISAQDAFIDEFVENSVVLGGIGLSALSSNTVYVPDLNVEGNLDVGANTVLNKLFLTNAPTGSTSSEILTLNISNGEVELKTLGDDIGCFGLTIDGAGSAITTGIKGSLIVPYPCTIDCWGVIADQSGSVVIDVWKGSSLTIPTSAVDSIAGTEKPTLASQQINTDLTLTSWTTGLVFGDVLVFNVDSASTVTRVTLQIKVIKL